MTKNDPVNTSSVWADIFALWRYLGKKRRLQFAFLLLLMLVVVLAEMVSIGAVVPFLTVLTTPETLLEIDWLQPVIQALGVKSSDELLLPLTICFVVATVFAVGVRILLLWVNSRLTVAMGVQLRSDLYTQVLCQPYEYHATHNSSDLISMVTEKVGAAIGAGIMHVLLMTSAGVMSLAIIATLLWVNSLVALVMFVVLSGGYVMAWYLVRHAIKRNSQIIARYQPQSVKCLQEGVGGIRDVIMGGSQGIFSKNYTQTAHQIQQAQTQNDFLDVLPKPIVELLGISIIALLAYSLQSQSETQSALPVLGALALGAQRLLPGLQQVYFSWSYINGKRAILNDIVQQLPQQLPSYDQVQTRQPLVFKTSLELKNLGFSYAGSQQAVLNNIDLVIPKGSRIGFIGETGSGKSTLLDIIMGLLSPTEGKIFVDGSELNQQNVKHWQANIAHVPQSIFLSDVSIAENIALGIPQSEIDLDQVKEAARQAQISTYIESLPAAYQTLVGERGVRLSGGQRQRIGIARAIYKRAEVIIFDEATSALDSKTEASVMKAINSLGSDLTIIIIAHRLSTLKGCDLIFRISDGQVSCDFSRITSAT